MSAFETTEVYPGIHLIKVPLPDNPLKFLNSYLIEDSDRPLLVDVGFNHAVCENALRGALDSFGLKCADVDVLFTHAHPDHAGCIERIWDESMTLYGNFESFRDICSVNEMQETIYVPLMNVVLDDARARRQSCGKEIPVEFIPLNIKAPVTYVGEGDAINRGSFSFSVIETPGHEDHHICLYDKKAKIVIIGDHVLERITPNISSFLLETDKLGQFFDSLDKVRDLDVDLVLPGHADPFTHLAKRVDELKAHHEGRLAEMVELVGDGHHDLIDITAHAHWKYPNWQNWDTTQKYFSLGETLAHLVHEVHASRLKLTICGTSVNFYLA